MAAEAVANAGLTTRMGQTVRRLSDSATRANLFQPMPAPLALTELLNRFHQHVDAYKAGKYNETQLRRDFLDPLFGLLGWDMDNASGHAEAYRDVVHEDALRVGGAAKAPDYGFRIGGTRKFFLEAKKPSVRIKEEIEPAYQLRRYAWSAKLPLSILSDFEEFAVYDCRYKPQPTDSASKARIFYCRYTDYEEKWDWIASIFSREAVLKGSFDKFAFTSKAKRGTTAVDDDFLEAIESWREELARNIALRNKKITQRELNFAVQRVLDRIIFLRICEDRGIEDYQRLLRAVDAKGASYPRLVGLFEQADDRYNSGLFHFGEEKGRNEQPDGLTLGLDIDDDLLRRLIRSLYYPESPYEFSVLSADILGQVYERFLGKVIRLTESHQARVEVKPEVRKAGGVFYTPTYVVEYIVRESLGPLLAGRTPKQAAKLRVLDPSCGSGSFLIGAYQYLLDWHVNWYTSNSPESWAKGKQPALAAPQGGGWALTTAERKRILLANIFGLDIDPQAVEVTKLSLLLKVLENETASTIQRELISARVLPDLGDNIKCGNSLIESDFYNPLAAMLLDDEAQYKVNVFDWKSQHGFAAAMKAGGFDAVIGNPPWGASFIEDELAYLRRRYPEVIARTVDSYIYFVAASNRICQEGAPIGFIVPSTILNQVDAKPARKLVLARGISHVASLGQGVFGPKVLNTSTILISGGDGSKRDQVTVMDVGQSPPFAREAELRTTRTVNRSEWESQVEADPHQTFFTGSLDKSQLLEKLRQRHSPLSDALEGSIARGVSPDIVAAHSLTPKEAKELKIEKAILKPSISGAQIKRYQPWVSDQVILYTTRETQLKNFPNAERHLRGFKDKNTCPEVRDGSHPYWALHRPRDPRIFDAPKFIGLTTAKTIEIVYDHDAGVFATDAMYVFRPRTGVNSNVLLAVMQSRLFLWLYRVSNQGDARVIPQIKATKLAPLPVPTRLMFPKTAADQAISDRLGRLVEQIQELVERRAMSQTPHERDALDRKVLATDEMIEDAVRAMYGLTADEVKVVDAE